jgi:hypothetical protein
MLSPADNPDYPLALRQADQTRSDFAAIESDLQLVMSQLARMPTRAYVAADHGQSVDSARGRRIVA